MVLFSQISHCSLLWNSGTFSLVNNAFSNSDVTPQDGTDTRAVMDKSTCLLCQEKNGSCKVILEFCLYVGSPQSSQYLEVSRVLTASSAENAQVLAQALEDFMLMSALKKGRKRDSGNSSQGKSMGDLGGVCL